MRFGLELCFDHRLKELCQLHAPVQIGRQRTHQVRLFPTCANMLFFFLILSSSPKLGLG